MPLTVSWQQIVLRLVCAFLAGAIVGANRDEKGRPAGMRTNVLVCVAACVAMLQANLLMNSTGKASNSFVVLDLMRMPLGILTGIGFIGAGAIVRRGDMISGVTTAATIWMMTVVGLCFGGGQLWLGASGVTLTLVTLLALKWVEHRIDHRRSGRLVVTLNENLLAEEDLRARLLVERLHIHSWAISASTDAQEKTIECEVRWTQHARDAYPPPLIHDLLRASGVIHLRWQG